MYPAGQIRSAVDLCQAVGRSDGGHAAQRGSGHFRGGTDSPTASSTLKEIARSGSEALPESAAGAPGRPQQAGGQQKDAGLGRDQELEAYLHVSLRLPLPGLCQS